MTRGWWRRNAVALAALVLLVPATVGVIAANEWSDWDLGHATKATTVDAGDATTYGGATIGPASAEFTDDAGIPPAPASSTRQSSSLRATSRSAACLRSCAKPAARSDSGTRRPSNWTGTTTPSLKTSCDSELPIRYSLTLDYLVPEDATGPFALELSTGDALPQFVRLVVEP